MTGHRGVESDFELATLERLERLGYRHVFGPEIERPLDEVILPDVLREWLARRYPDLPASALDEAFHKITRPDGADTLRRNLNFHQLLTRGFELKVEWPDGRVEHRHLYAVDWERPDANDFRAVNQFPVHGQNDRRPDIVVFVNGLPLVVYELKNPHSASATVDDAFNQIQHYTYGIAQLFDYNALVVLSDGNHTLHGMWTASMEWYAPWKSINGFDVEPTTTASMKTLIEGLFPKDRLLGYIRDFIVFEVAGDKITKKGAKYHQFFAVRLAVEKTLAIVRAGLRPAPTDRRIGVIWHTTGSGKSLSMAFLVGILRRHPELENPLFVIQVDRTDLDDQLADQFLVARSLVGDAQQATNVDDLRDLLKTEGGAVILTTIEKFMLKEGETAHPVLNARRNVIVIADEAHRSQYGFESGFARYLAEALPNALRLGFTGTPISLSGADTVEVFGDLLHTYTIAQSQIDRATVPIFYEPRLIKLDIKRNDLDAALEEIEQAHGVEASDRARHRARWAALSAAARADDRVGELARDLLDHFRERTANLDGKALIVCMERENCVKLYNALRALPECPEVRIVMTGNLSEDPPEWSAAGHLTTKTQRDTIKKRMIDPDDPLKIVIVCDMWLTGTDIPCLHTLYVDKPMRGHTMIQAISRVNRVFRNKPHGLVVDYIGIGDDLREAAARYTQSGDAAQPAPDLRETARPLFLAALDAARQTLPPGKDYGGWRELSRIDIEDLYAFVYGSLADDEVKREAFLQSETRLTDAFLLVKHLDDCRPFADEVIFYQRTRKQITKVEPGAKTGRAIEQAVRDLVDDSVESEGVVDIFRVAGIERADISILDDRFLQTFKDRPHENLRLKLLQKLVQDEIFRRRSRNLAKAKSFQELLEKTLEQYHNRVIDAALVVKTLVEMRQEWQNDDGRAAALNLTPEELAFYDAVATNFLNLYNEAFLRDLVHDVVQAVKKNLKVDWTKPHREDIKASVRAAARRVLRKRDVKEADLEPFLGIILEQAVALYAEWPVGEYAELSGEGGMNAHF